MNYYAAKEFCEKDGRHVINVDTKERQDLAQILPLTSTYLYAQGKRHTLTTQEESSTGHRE